MSFKERFWGFVGELEKVRFSAAEWLLAVLGIIFLRSFLEGFSNPRIDGAFLPPWSAFLFHYPLFYISLLLSIIIVLFIFARRSIDSISSIALLFFPIILLPPIIDLLVTAGNGFRLAYLWEDGDGLLGDFLSFFGSFAQPGISLGVRIEIALILFFVFIYVKKQAGWRRALFASFFVYALIFIFLSFPSLIVLGSKIFGGFSLSYPSREVTSFYYDVFGLKPVFSFVDENFGDQFSYFFSRFYLVLIVVLAPIWLFLKDKSKTLAFLTNSRPERIAFYCLIGLLGFFIGGAHSLSLSIGLSLILFLLVITSSWLYAVQVNDLADQDIDRISNPWRPLLSGALKPEEISAVAPFFLIFSLLGSLLISAKVFIAFLVFNSAYYVYSAHPLRLKRIPIFSSFLIALAASAVFLAGFFISNPDGVIDSSFRLSLLFFVLAITFLANVRDLKDAAGDKAANIKTLPVLIGEKKAKLIIGFLFLVFPPLTSFFIPDFKFLFYPSFIFGVYFFWAINRKKYNEKFVFAGIILYLLLLNLVFFLP